MPIEVGVWKVGAVSERVVFSPIAKERDLEDILAANIGILDPELMLIGRQVPTAYGKFIDLLGMNREGNLVVIELKRDRTPRDVVAQVLDYGSWVSSLKDEEIAQIFETFLEKYSPASPSISLDEAFRANFHGADVPEALNEAHELIVAAAELDDSTERIISYLTGFGVAVNAVFFRFFKDGDAEYLTRAWLVEPDAVDDRVRQGRTKLPWNGEYYVSFGHDSHGRHWDDARKYGFISAGGGEWYSRTLNMLEPGGRIWVNVPKTGYVGVGIVEAGPVLAQEFMVPDGKGGSVPITNMELQGDLHQPSDNAPGTDEYLVRVKWIRTVPLAEAISEKGFFGNQNSAAQPRAQSWRHTVDRLKIRLDVKDS